MRTSARGSRRREALGDERRKRTEARKKTMATVADCLVVGTTRRRRKRRGPEVQREEDGEGELLGINGEARDGRGSDADDHSG